MNTSDLLIIGAGPGGYETAVKAAVRGLSVTLIERDEAGGTCLNRGCIPTKTLCRSAEVMLTARKAAEFGVCINAPEVDFSVVAARKDAVVAELRSGVETLLAGVNVVRGEARFISPSEVEAAGELYTAARIIVATGSAPSRLPVAGAEYALTSDEFLSLDTLPESVIIIGGGVIGLEFASIMDAFGVAVTVIEFCKEILPPFDSEVAKRLRMALKKRGISIITDARVTSIEKDGKVTYENKGKEKQAQAECVLMAVGRRPVIPAGLVEAGAMLDRGFLKVDDCMKLQWSAEAAPASAELYAIGDVNGRCMLAHAATAQGDIVLGEKRDLGTVPSAVFTMPECAMVGLTEEQCKERGLNVRIGKSTFRANGKALAMGETDGLVKTITDVDTGLLLGCHICGPHAADLVAEAALAISCKLPTTSIADTIHSHPTLSETLPSAIESM